MDTSWSRPYTAASPESLNVWWWMG